MLRFDVVTFDSESLNSTDEAALRVYHFNLDVFGPHASALDFRNSKTLPSNTSDLCLPGFFHSEPSSRLLALEIVVPSEYCGMGGIPRYVLYVPHDVLLGYMRLHPSESLTVVVPWKAWGSGNAHILALPPRYNQRRSYFEGHKSVCGMYAITEPPMVIVQGDQRMLRIMDYHRRRIFRNSVTGASMNTLLPGAADSYKGLGPITSALQEAADENIPYVFKDIPFPGGLQLENIRCALGEDVVAVFEVRSKSFGGAIRGSSLHSRFLVFFSPPI